MLLAVVLAAHITSVIRAALRTSDWHMMRVNAYILAADPTWLRASVAAYYPHVEKLVVSYDANRRGWTGAPIRVEQCLAVLRSLDVERKIEWAPGDFASSSTDFLAAETRQRRAALRLAAAGADWVLQIDTDEILPEWAALLKALEIGAERGLPAIEWPMRVLYRRLSGGRFLEVATSANTTHFEYPGPIAVRAGVELVDCRRADCDYLRPLVIGDRCSLQVQRPPDSGEYRVEMLAAEAAIWHNSWARPPVAVREKVASWGHNQGLRTRLYYYTTWLPAPVTWRALRRFHPLYPALWPRLRLLTQFPSALEEAGE